MIVIGTNNGRGWLHNSLKALDGIHIPIAVIDTNSTERDAIDYHQSLSNHSFDLDIQTHTTPYKGYDSGAWIWAMKNIEAERYYFLQDSITIKDKEYFNKVNEIIDNGKVASLLHFNPNQYDSFEQHLWVMESFGSSIYKSGIFGPNFSISSDMTKRIPLESLIYPTNKLEQMGMERGWGVIFNNMGWEVEAVEGDYDYDRLLKDDYKLFTKRFGGRR